MVSKSALPKPVVVEFPSSRLGTSRTACAGTAAAFLLRHLADKTGLPSTPSMERLLFSLGIPRNGGNVPRLAEWFGANTPGLRRLGLRVVARRVAFKTPWIIDWVSKGNGFRGAVLQTERFRLHTGVQPPAVDMSHAVALAVDESARKPGVAMVDPWPGSDPMAKAPPTLEPAHKAAKYGTLVIHWTGWS